MYESLLPATIAMLKCLNAEGVYMSISAIDDEVFYSVADEHILKTLLYEMRADGLLSLGTNGRFKITDKGGMFLERQGYFSQ